MEHQMNTISAERLQKLDLPPVRWAVEGILPQGTAVLSAASKVGKSWMALDLALAVAQGTPFLGRQCRQCGVLYLALEDSYNRLRDRLGKLLGDSAAPAALDFQNDCMTMDGDGFGEMLRDYAQGHPGLGLVIVDTLQRIRCSGGGRESMYARDYKEMGALKNLADELGVCLLLVHHNRKMPDDTDPFNLISGSTGIMGVADTIWVITKKHRKDDRAALHVTGREVVQESLELSFDKKLFRWRFLGSREQVRFQEEQDAWRREPLAGAVRALLERCGGQWAGTAAALLERLNEVSPVPVADTARRLAAMLDNVDGKLAKFDSILYIKQNINGDHTEHRFITERCIKEDLERRELGTEIDSKEEKRIREEEEVLWQNL